MWAPLAPGAKVMRTDDVDTLACAHQDLRQGIMKGQRGRVSDPHESSACTVFMIFFKTVGTDHGYEVLSFIAVTRAKRETL